MTEDQESKCHYIIHSHAVAAAAGNAVPVPGLGIAADMVTMTSMTMSLCAVFGGSLTQEAAKALAIAAIKNTMLKQPIKTLTKELSKLIPGLGQIVAPSISVVMLESAGWVLAKELEQNTRKAGTYIEGIKSIEADILLFVDADNSFFIEDISLMINIILKGYYDIVAGTKDLAAEKRPLIRKILSFGKRTLTKNMLPKGVYDSQTGLKAIKASSAKFILPYLSRSRGLAIDLELMYYAKKLNFRVLQLPVKYIDRDGSHVDVIKDSLSYLKNIYLIIKDSKNKWKNR